MIGVNKITRNNLFNILFPLYLYASALKANEKRTFVLCNYIINARIV